MLRSVRAAGGDDGDAERSAGGAEELEVVAWRIRQFKLLQEGKADE